MSNRLFRRLGRLAYRGCSMSSRKKGPIELSDLVAPLPVKLSKNLDDINVLTDLGGKVSRSDVNQILDRFARQPKVLRLANENGMDQKLFTQAFNSFRGSCLELDFLDPSLHIILSDLAAKSGHLTDLFPYFLKHAKEVYPHLDCLDELICISDLRIPANAYPDARAMKRRIIFHAGPTNSGKTYHALKAFNESSRGVYCGPLKMLAVEVFHKTNEGGVECDLLTGEERQEIVPGEKSNHVACTVEMASISDPVEVAVIDEIQMIKDYQRGWAWTRALLGLQADEIHLCGEEAAIPLIEKILLSTGEKLEIERYQRLTPLIVEQRCLRSLRYLQPGDCVVCFSKNDIYSASLACERLGYECAVIYGGLPPNTKAAQARKFNDPLDPCKILIATDAIGMGLNLSIRRIVFYSTSKISNETSIREKNTLSTSQLLQIAGRAGRFKTRWNTGFVTTLREKDHQLLKEIMMKKPEPIEQAGIHPSADQLELFAFHLPKLSMSSLLEIFISLTQLDSFNYFMCNLETFKDIAKRTDHIIMPVRARYVFCSAPINLRNELAASVLVKFASCYAKNQAITAEWMMKECNLPAEVPKNIPELLALEETFDACDLYLWLGLRFRDLFPEIEEVRALRKDIDDKIEEGMKSLTALIQGKRLPRGVTSIIRKGDGDLKKLQTSKLTSQLLSEGLITKEQLQAMREEWLNESKEP